MTIRTTSPGSPSTCARCSGCPRAPPRSDRTGGWHSAPRGGAKSNEGVRRRDMCADATHRNQRYSPAMSTRIGILTGGGDCPGLNGVIRAVTLHARQTFGWEVLGIKNGFEGLYEEDYVELTAQRVQHSLQRGGTMLGSSNRANPFAYPVRLPDGRIEIHDVSIRCMANLARLDPHGLIVVGGDGSMS